MAMGMDSSQRHLQTVILSQLTAQTRVYMKNIIIPALPNLLYEFPLPFVQFLNSLAYSQDNKRGEKPLQPQGEKCIVKTPAFHVAHLTPSPALCITASSRSVNGGIPETLNFPETACFFKKNNETLTKGY